MRHVLLLKITPCMVSIQGELTASPALDVPANTSGARNDNVPHVDFMSAPGLSHRRSHDTGLSTSVNTPSPLYYRQQIYSNTNNSNI